MFYSRKFTLFMMLIIILLIGIVGVSDYIIISIRKYKKKDMKIKNHNNN